MERIFELLFNLTTPTWMDILLKLIALIIISVIIVFILFICISLISKVICKKGKRHSDHRIPLMILWSLLGYCLIFSTYFFIVLYINGYELVNLKDWRFYVPAIDTASIFPLIFIYVVIGIILLAISKKLKKAIKTQ